MAASVAGLKRISNWRSNPRSPISRTRKPTPKGGRVVRNLLAYRIGATVTNNVEYCVSTSIFSKELADGVDKSELIKELRTRGWLKPSIEGDRHTVKRTIDGKRIAVFVFREFWNQQDNEQLDLSTSENERDTRDERDNNVETLTDTGLRSSHDLSRDEDTNGPAISRGSNVIDDRQLRGY